MKVLFVSIAFPPKSDPESLQVLKYYTYLKEKSDLDITVITSRNPTLFMEPDPGLEEHMTGYEQLIEISIRESKLSNFVKRKVKSDILSFPDSKHSFFKNHKAIANSVKHRPDIIYSRSFPLSSTIMAYHMADHFDVPWVMHLSDPWTFNTKKTKGLSDAQKWNLEWEEKCIDKADFVTFTSEKTIEFYKSKFPNHASKFGFYPNVYDLKKDVAVPVKRKEKTRIRMVYTGGLTQGRNPKFLLDAVKKISDSDFGKHVRMELIGPKDRFVKNLIEEYQFDFVHDLPSMSYEDSKKVQQQADILFLVDAPTNDEKKSVFFPSKILDYMMAKREIWAITPNGSTTSDVIKKYNLGKTFDYSEQDKLCEALKELSNRNPEDEYKGYELPEDFDASYNVNKLYQLFKDLHEKREK